MADKEVTQRALAAKVAADVGSTVAPFTAYLEACLSSTNKQRFDVARSRAARCDPTRDVY